MRAFEIIKGHVIYNPAYTYKFQLKTTIMSKVLVLESYVLNFYPPKSGLRILISI